MNDPNQPAGVLLPFPNTSYHAPWRLMIWRPAHVLDDSLLDQVIDFVEFEERTLGSSFNRFLDFSALTEIHLKIGHVFKISERRREVAASHDPVKGAIYASTVIGFGMARLYEHMMEGSQIDVRAFRELAAAAEWLGAPVEVLHAAHSN